MYRREREKYERTKTFFLVHNFINWFLTGAKDGGVRVMELGDTAGMALWHPKRKTWSQKICRAISENLISKLPPVLDSDKAIGTIGAALVDRYGFRPDCQVGAGSGDNMFGAVGTGNVSPGIVTISLGTSGTAYTVLPEYFRGQDGEIASFCDSTGNYLPLLCVSNMANGYHQLLQKYAMTYQDFDEALTQTPPGNEGRLVFPWFQGERTPNLPDAVPVYWGFGLGDFTKENLCRSVLEGHILNLYDGFTHLPARPREIRLTGGLSRSDSWCQVIADVFEAEAVPVKGEGAALGAAVHGAWVLDQKKMTLEELTKVFTELDEGLRKTPRNSASYQDLKMIFSEMSRRMRLKATEIDPFRLSQSGRLSC